MFFLLYLHSPCFVSILMANAFFLVVYVWQLMLKDPLREISPVEWKLFYKMSANSVQLRRHCLWMPVSYCWNCKFLWGKSIQITWKSILLTMWSAKNFMFLRLKQSKLNSAVFQSWVCSFGAQFVCYYQNNVPELLAQTTAVYWSVVGLNWWVLCW